MTRTGRRPLTVAVFAGLLLATVAPPAVGVTSSCGPMDVAFVIDVTGSMGGALDDLKGGSSRFLNQIETASGGSYRLGLITFTDVVRVDEDLASGNKASIRTKLDAQSPAGGGELPEASDEGLHTAIKGLDAADRDPGQQIGDFGAFRRGAVKIVVLVTDALPGGFDDSYVAGIDDENAHRRGVEARERGIRIASVYVPTGGSDPAEVAIMKDYATTSRGLYAATDPDGTGAADAISRAVSACGGEQPRCPGYQEVKANHVIGTAGPDVLEGTAGVDVICGLAGNDRILGRGGADILDGGADRDWIHGHGGGDHVVAGRGNDNVTGGGGPDTIWGGAGRDWLRGNAGHDRILGQGSDDLLRGSTGNDVLSGGAGNDHLNGGDGSNACDGGAGTNILESC